MSGKLFQPDKDFRVGSLTDELVGAVLSLCGKDDTHNPIFPKRFYDGAGNWVPYIIGTATEIHRSVIIANQTQGGEGRAELQRNAMRNLVLLNHQLRISREKGWISDKQLSGVLTLSNACYFKIKSWYMSDQKLK